MAVPIAQIKNQKFNKSAIKTLPVMPGVYLFYGTEDVLLYVGKSKTIRARVRSHFSAKDERWLTKRICRIEVRETAGELGALLLESKLIKELRPMYNVRSRQPRRIIIARRLENVQGYATVKLEAVDYLDLKPEAPILGIFKHKTQAREFLETISKTHRLCSKLLRLENSHGCCFPYHLGHCGGACIGEEDAAVYNARVEAAFEARRIIAWPFEGPITVEEISKDKKMHEAFVIDNWCLIAGSRNNNRSGKSENLFSPHRFDYDTYKLLYSYVMDEGNIIQRHTKKEIQTS
jgi:DNA polymerase III subunit epsilon